MTDASVTDLQQLLIDLVTVDTTNPGGDERAGVEVLASLFRKAGLSVDIDEYQPGNVNLTATARFGDGPTLLLNSHIDVVPTGAGWSSPPFAPRIDDGRIYGRGTADAKGSLAAMAAALMAVLAAPEGVAGTIIFTAVGDEEGGSTGARALVQTVTADACIVGEPTNLRLLAAHKGSVRPVVEVRGSAAHAATPQNGVNAIVSAAGLITTLEDFARRLISRAHPLVGPPTLTCVLINGGEAPNAVPETTRITLDRRLVPGENADAAVEEITELLALWSTENAPLEARIIDRAPSTGGPSETPVDHPFVSRARAALTELGEDDEIGGLVVNCDMTTFRTAGIPTIVLGPGTLEVMHAKDEFVELDQLHRAAAAYEAIIRRYFRAASL